MADTTFIDRSTPIVADWLNDVNDTVYGLPSTASGKGTALIGSEDAGGWYQATTAEGQLQEIAALGPALNVLSLIPSTEWAAILDGTSTYDATTEVNAALTKSKVIKIPGRIKITSQIVIPSTAGAIIGDDPYTCYFDKQFNGDAFKCDTSGFKFVSVGIEGNGLTYTGGGIRPRGYNILISHCRINGTADSPVIVEAAIGSNTLAATYLRVDSCFLKPYDDTTTYSIRSVGDDDSTRPTCRVFTHLNGGSSGPDFSGMNYVVLADSLVGSVKFSANSGKVHMSANRITSQNDITVYGVDHVLDGNFWGFATGKNLYFDSGCGNVNFSKSNQVVINSSSNSNPVDNGAPPTSAMGVASTNNINVGLSTFPLTWTASVTNPTLGNSTTYANYSRDGRWCWASFGLVRGSTATVGSGDYSFQLPFKALVNATGVARIKSSTGTYFSAVVTVIGGSSQAQMTIDTQTAVWGSASISFGTGGTLDCTITYLIATT